MSATMFMAVNAVCYVPIDCIEQTRLLIVSVRGKHSFIYDEKIRRTSSFEENSRYFMMRRTVFIRDVLFENVEFKGALGTGALGQWLNGYHCGLSLFALMVVINVFVLVRGIE